MAIKVGKWVTITSLQTLTEPNTQSPKTQLREVLGLQDDLETFKHVEVEK